MTDFADLGHVLPARLGRHRPELLRRQLHPARVPGRASALHGHGTVVLPAKQLPGRPLRPQPSNKTINNNNYVNGYAQVTR